ALDAKDFGASQLAGAFGNLITPHAYNSKETDPRIAVEKEYHMTRFLLRWAVNAAGLYAAIWIVPGINFIGDWTGILWIALIFGLLNALVRPLLKFLTCPLIILTLGLFTIVVNT